MPAAKGSTHQPPDVWDVEARRLIRGAMATYGYTNKSLARALEDSGYGANNEEAVGLRIKRGSFSMGFALRVLRVMGACKLDIGHIKMHKPPKER